MDEFLNYLIEYNSYIAAVVTICIGLFLLRYLCAGGVCRSNARVDGQTIIITGGNAGIGFETAKELARRGGRIIIACRNVRKGEIAAAEVRRDTGNKNVAVRQLDLASLQSVRDFCKRIMETEVRLDILINNAGVMACPESKTEDGFEMQFGTNHLGHFLLTNLLLDLLKKSTPSRVVTVSSIGHTHGKMHFDNISLKGEYESFKAYTQSKLANVLFTKELARRLSNTGVVCMALHPGVVNTNLTQHLSAPVRYLVRLFAPFLKTAFEGAQTSLHCALLHPSSEMRAGNLFYFSDCALKEPSSRAQLDSDARRLWEMSEEMVGLHQ